MRPHNQETRIRTSCDRRISVLPETLQYGSQDDFAKTNPRVAATSAELGPCAGSQLCLRRTASSFERTTNAAARRRFYLI